MGALNGFELSTNGFIERIEVTTSAHSSTTIGKYYIQANTVDDNFTNAKPNTVSSLPCFPWLNNGYSLQKYSDWLLFKIRCVYTYTRIIGNERSIDRKSRIRVNIGHSANESSNELWILIIGT